MEHIADRVYHALKRTYEGVKEPGKSALSIPLESYAESLNIGANMLQFAIQCLLRGRRIYARKLDYPSPIPETWEISFPTQYTPEPTYTVTTHQRTRVFAHVLGIVVSIDKLNGWEEYERPFDGAEALDVFFSCAEAYHCEDVLAVFNALPGTPYTDFIHFWNSIAPLKPQDVEATRPGEQDLDNEPLYELNHHWEEQQALNRDCVIQYKL